MKIFGERIHSLRGSIPDTCVPEFFDLPEQFSEKNLRKAIIGNLKQLLYNRALSCLVPVELKIGKFKPEHIGQIKFCL